MATDVITNDTDLDNTNAQLLVVEASISATNGTATLGADGRTIRFTPDANKNDGNVGPAGFTVTYRATDGDLVSNEATLTISGQRGQRQPGRSRRRRRAHDEDTLVATDVNANDTDVDNTNAELSVVEASISATNGTATLGADGRTIRFTPDANKNNGNVGAGGFTVTYTRHRRGPGLQRGHLDDQRSARSTTTRSPSTTTRPRLRTPWWPPT